MGSQIVAGADGRSWKVSWTVLTRYKESLRTYSLEEDRLRFGHLALVGPLLFALSALIGLRVIIAYWSVGLEIYSSYIWVAMGFLIVAYAVRWVATRSWTIVAMTAGTENFMPAEVWEGTLIGRGRTRQELKVIIHSIRTRATPGYGGGALYPKL